MELAYLELEERLAALSDDVQLLGKQIKTELDDETLTLYCTVTCIENIAVQREFEITEQP